jgi:DNA-binding NtrC family response regulator
LARRFLDLARTANARPNITLGDDALAAMVRHPFPGNVRELKNLVERLVILSPDDSINALDVEAAIGSAGSVPRGSLYRPGVPFKVLADEAERAIIEEALAHHGRQMTATARALGLERSHLYKKAKALGLRGDGDKGEPDDG